MVEPTETETKETLDHFAEIVAEILREAREDPEIARSAPYTTPVRRLDEAARPRADPVVRQTMTGTDRAPHAVRDLRRGRDRRRRRREAVTSPASTWR